MRPTASPLDNLRRLGLALPPPPKPIAIFRTYRIDQSLLFLSGQGPIKPDGTVLRGKVGDTLTVEEAYEHARLVGLRLLSTANEALGDLSRVTAVVKVLGFVNARSDFEDHPRVINGCSDLFVDVFGPAGEHARSAVGAASLPLGISVEIEAIFAFRR